MSDADFSTGQKVELNDLRLGTVRFVGTVHFQTGGWVGIELEEASGKNDGSVQGERYFACRANHGIFVRPAGIGRVVEEVKSKAKPVTNGTSGKSRPSSVSAPAINVNGARRQTLQDRPAGRAGAYGGTSPTPAGRPMRGIPSPSKSPTKQLAANGTSSSSTSRTNTPPAAVMRPGVGTAAKSRPSMAPSSILPGRRTSNTPSAGSASTQRTSKTPSAAPASLRTSTARPGRAPLTAARDTLSPLSDQGSRLSSTTEDDTTDGNGAQAGMLSPRESTMSSKSEAEPEVEGGQEGEEDEEQGARPNFAPPPMPPIPPVSPERVMRNRRPSSPTAASIHSQRTMRSTVATTRQIEELEAKNRVLERKQMEDRELKEGLQQAQQERDHCKGIIDKLQSKYRLQLQEMEKLKKELAEYEKKSFSVEEIEANHDQAIESATLDKEVAEETAEGLKADMEILRANNVEMQLELEILREENSELSKEMSPEERTSAGWLQLEQSNDRLKAALLRLRDITQDEKAELQEQIGELEEQAKEQATADVRYQETREKLLRTEADVEDLREQLDAAGHADEMIETLGEENMDLRERMKVLRGVIDDLESLKELNDELEVNHVEAEKQLQEEIDFKESLLLDRERTAKEQQAALDEADYNINRFRALVGQLQNDLKDLEASKQITESEAAQLSTKSRAMVDLNMKLQFSAAKTQVKTIDLELRRLDAQQASEHLAIVQLFLPESFDPERDSVLALLRFKRIAFKANLVQSFVQERITTFGTRGYDEDVFTACDTADKLTWIAAMADRFANAASGCGAEEFAQYGSALYELKVVERTLDDYIDEVRRDDFGESAMNVRFGRCMEVMTDLAGVHSIHTGLSEYADDLLMRSLCLQSQLQNAISAFTLTRTMLENNLLNAADKEAEDEEDNATDTAIILQRLGAIIDQVRNAKVVSGKTQRALSELQERSLTLEASCTEHFVSAGAVSSDIAAYANRTGAELQSLFGEEGRVEAFSPSEVAAVLSRLAASTFDLSAAEPGPYSALTGRVRDLASSLADLSILPTDLDNTVEFDRAPAPWVARAEELKQRKIASKDLTAELARAVETVREREGLLNTKETELEEQSVRIEMLEARMKDASKRSARIGELERHLHEAKEGEKRAKHALAKAHQEAQHDIERVREEMARLAEERKNTGGAKDIDGDAMGVRTRTIMRRQEHKITGLEGAVRHLTDENQQLRLPSPDAPKAMLSTLDWLHTPLQKPKSAQRKRQEALQRQGERVLEDMLALASRSQIVDLTSIPDNKLAWRPAKESSRWKVERCNEEWAKWKQRRRDVVKAAHTDDVLT